VALAVAIGLGGACGKDTPPLPMTMPAPGVPFVPTPAAPEPAPQAAGATRIRRLANVEIENVVSDLLGGPSGLTAGFLDDPRPHGYDTDADQLLVSESKFDELGAMAERVAAKLTDADHLGPAGPCPAGPTADACARRFIAATTRNSWGRLADPDEESRLLQVFGTGVATGAAQNDMTAGLALVAEAILLSPHFVYRTELGSPAAAGPTTLTGAEIASAISFLTRGARPDAPLLEAGLGGQLLEPATRAAHAARLLATPGGRHQMARFVRSWLGIDDVAVINKDLAVFPQFTPPLRQAISRELVTFLDHVFAEAGGRLDELLLADYTFPGPPESIIYGAGELLDPIGDFSRVRLDPARRRGLLSSPAFLARHALVGQTNPVERGLLVRSQILCMEVPPPPPSVQATTPMGGAETTTRSKYEAHQTDASCHGCHQFLDALGFGFEQFDPIGRFRSHEGANPVDATGVVVGSDVDGTFVGPAALAERLQKSAIVRRCLVQQLWQFAQGRELTAADQPEIDFLAWRFAQADASIPNLIETMVARPGFILRTPAPAPATTMAGAP
jgi:hypothetical protein